MITFTIAALEWMVNQVIGLLDWASDTGLVMTFPLLIMIAMVYLVMAEEVEEAE